MSEKMVVMTFKLPRSLAEVLAEYAEKHNMYRSEVIRRALMNYLYVHMCKPYVTRRLRIWGGCRG